jgi:hypothetical protein
MKVVALLLTILIVSFVDIAAQTRQANHTNLEFGVGKVFYKNIFSKDYVEALDQSAVYSIGINKVTKYKNLHKLNLIYTQENNLSTVINTKLSYSFEKTVSRGKYGRGFLGFSIGGGGGFERYDSTYVQKMRFFPFALVGMNYEYFITRNFSIYLKSEGHFAFSPIVNNVQNLSGLGIKIKLNKSKSI